MTRAWIGIGSNQDDPPSQVRNALRELARAGEVKAVSRLYRTRPWGVTAQPEFCNAVAELETALTPREREILVLVAQGKSNREIAKALTISERTARTHVSSVLTKLGLASRTQAALWAVREGLVPSG